MSKLIEALSLEPNKLYVLKASKGHVSREAMRSLNDELKEFGSKVILLEVRGDINQVSFERSAELDMGNNKAKENEGG